MDLRAADAAEAEGGRHDASATTTSSRDALSRKEDGKEEEEKERKEEEEEEVLAEERERAAIPECGTELRFVSLTLLWRFIFEAVKEERKELEFYSASNGRHCIH